MQALAPKASLYSWGAKLLKQYAFTPPPHMHSLDKLSLKTHLMHGELIPDHHNDLALQHQPVHLQGGCAWISCAWDQLQVWMGMWSVVHGIDMRISVNGEKQACGRLSHGRV